MEEYTPETEGSKSEELKNWFQDNLRIVISIAIVVIIAGGIYSYSKRTNSPIVADQTEQTGEVSSDASNAEVAPKTDDTKVTDNKSTSPAVSSNETSKETESSFVEAASKGEGLTKLARKATANYLEKNPDSSLTKEHKIYIEDFLRKNIGRKGGVTVGSSVEFSKDLITKAIAQSKNLNARQLKNLQKYTARVSSL